MTPATGKDERSLSRIKRLMLLAALAGLCLLAGRASARPNDDRSFYAKVLRMDAEKNEVEVELMIQPAKTRLVFEGQAAVARGDMVTFTIEDSQAEFGGARLRCRKVIWVLR